MIDFSNQKDNIEKYKLPTKTLEDCPETLKLLLEENDNSNPLRSADKETLQIVFFRMLDIPTEQIAEKMGLTPNAIYLRINRLKEKIKKLKMGERK